MEEQIVRELRASLKCVSRVVDIKEWSSEIPRMNISESKKIQTTYETVSLNDVT